LARLQYYSHLIAVGLIQKEQAHENLTPSQHDHARRWQHNRSHHNFDALIPDANVGTVNFLGLATGSKIANSLDGIAKVLYAVADITGTLASLRLTQAGWERRWRNGCSR